MSRFDSEPPQRHPDVIIVPESQFTHDRDAFLKSLDHDWGRLIDNELSRWQDVAKASRPDVHQAVLIILYQHYEKERNAGRPGAPENVPAFLRTIVGHAAMHHGRAKKCRPQLARDGEARDEPDEALDPEQAAILAEEQEAIDRGVARLTEEEAQVLDARAEGMTFEIIATALGCSVGTAYGLYTSALESLRAHVGEGAPRKNKKQ